MPILAKEKMSVLVGFSLKARLACGQKRPGESTWFKGKLTFQFSLVLFCFVLATENTYIFALV